MPNTPRGLQGHLEAGFRSRPPSAAAPLRRKPQDGPQTNTDLSKEWLGQLVAMHLVSDQPRLPNKVIPAEIKLVGEPSNVCGTDHAPVYEPARDSYFCKVCLTPLKKG